MGCNTKLDGTPRPANGTSQSSLGEDGLQPAFSFPFEPPVHTVSILSGRGWVATVGNTNSVQSEGSGRENRNLGSLMLLVH